MDHLVWYVVLGVVAGVISGSLGVGSGLVLVPALVLLFAQEQKSAQGIALAVMVPMAMVGAIRYVQNPDIKVDLAIVGVVALGGVAGALAGAYFASILPAGTLKKIFAVFLIVVAVRMLWPGGKRDRSGASGRPAAPPAMRSDEPTAGSTASNSGQAGRIAPRGGFG